MPIGIIGKKSIVTDLDPMVFAAGQGYIYDYWIDNTGRSNSYNDGDLIEQPAYIIESLLRDEILTERDLVIDAVTNSASASTVTFSTTTPLNSSVNDFYNGAFLVNVTKDGRYGVADYNGSTKVLTLDNTSLTAWAVSDKCYLKNINANIDEDSFDVVGAGLIESGTTTSTSAGKLIQTGQNFLTTVKAGMVVKNTTDTTYSYVHSVDSNTQLTLESDIMTSGESYQIYGQRYGWKFARSLTAQQDSRSLLEQLCFEMHCILIKSYNKYKLIALGDGNTVGTLSQPMFERGKPLVSAKLTPLSQIYTDFSLNYGYSYAKKIYTKRAFVNKNATSDSYLDNLKTKCSNAEKNYKVKNKWEYNADWIQDDTTALYFLEQIVNWFYQQRIIVSWTGSPKTHIHYEIGDRVLINYDFMIPTGKNNSASFMIIGKSFDESKKKIKFTLI